MKGPRPALSLALAALALAACTGRIHLGTEPPFWAADHETGDLSQWTMGDADAGISMDFGGIVTVEGDYAHSGSSAVRATIATTNGLSSARLNRRDVPQDASLRAWFYIPRRYTVIGYWDLFELQGLADPTSQSTPETLWSVCLRDGGSTEMTWYLWDNIHALEHSPVVPLAAPIGRWFQIEAYVHQATNDSGRITVWIDGTKLADVSGVATVPAMWLGWSIGSTSNAIAEQSVELYLDDATIIAARW